MDYKLIKPLNALLFALTFSLFWKTGTFDFINYDDPYYVYENSNVTSGLTLKNIRWAISATEMGNWNPITWLSHMLDCQLFGLNPHGHHLTSSLIHAANTVLLSITLTFITGSFLPSIFTAALFGLHPLHVESVAWISERKDLLSGLFFMLTILTYGWYVRKPGLKRYLLVSGAFAAGLSAKPMLVTLPFVLLLLDYWPLNRFEPANTVTAGHGSHQPFSTLPVWLEKIPLLFMSISISILTFAIQKNHGNLVLLDQHPIASRLANALVSYSTYIAKTLWPENLAVFYPINPQLPLWQIVGSLVFMVCTTITVFLKRNNHPFLITGWLWFIITLTPVIGILQVGLQSRADRYTYLPLIGIFIIIAWSVDTVLTRWFRPNNGIVVSVIAIFTLSCFAFASYRQLDFWKDGTTLYTRALEVTRNNFIVHYNLAATLANKGLYDKAIFHYREAIRTAPDFFEEAYLSLGFELDEKGEYREATGYYYEILRRNPENTTARERINTNIKRITNRH